MTVLFLLKHCPWPWSVERKAHYHLQNSKDKDAEFSSMTFLMLWWSIPLLKWPVLMLFWLCYILIAQHRSPWFCAWRFLVAESWPWAKHGFWTGSVSITEELGRNTVSQASPQTTSWEPVDDTLTLQMILMPAENWDPPHCQALKMREMEWLQYHMMALQPFFLFVHGTLSVRRESFYMWISELVERNQAQQDFGITDRSSFTLWQPGPACVPSGLIGTELQTICQLWVSGSLGSMAFSGRPRHFAWDGGELITNDSPPAVTDKSWFLKAPAHNSGHSGAHL